MIRRPPRSTLFPYTTPSDLQSNLLRRLSPSPRPRVHKRKQRRTMPALRRWFARSRPSTTWISDKRSEEHTSELQSRQYLVFRLLLQKKIHDHLVIDLLEPPW